jgi:hypothetical protein
MLHENSLIRVVLGLVVGLAVIMYFNPPSTPCSAQIEVYTEALKSLKDPFSLAITKCNENPEPGGCLKFFDLLEKIESHFKEVGTKECLTELINEKTTRTWVTLSMETFTQLAWGAKPPPSYQYRNGWLELTQIVEFCRLKKHLEDIYGNDEWDKFATAVMADLPGASDLSQTEVWNRSLLSDPCKHAL